MCGAGHGSGPIGSTITPEIKEYDGWVLYEEGQGEPFVLKRKEKSSDNSCRILYVKLSQWTIHYVCQTDGEELATETGYGRIRTNISIPDKAFDGHTRVTTDETFYFKDPAKAFTVYYKADEADSESAETDDEVEGEANEADSESAETDDGAEAAALTVREILD